MRHVKMVPGPVLLMAFVGCASARPVSLPTTGPKSSREAAQQLCSGVSEEQRSTSLCFDTDEILRVERMPVDERGGDVLTGLRMVFRAVPGRTAQSFQRLVDCQIAMNALGESHEQYPRMTYCPLAIKGVTALVQPVADGLAVEVRPNDAPNSRRISHTLAHGSMALQLARFESSECRGIEPKARAACPLLGPVSALNDLPQGVRVEFPEWVSVDDVTAAMRCHYSFAQARGFSEEAAACPLYMRGLHIERSTNRRAIDITITPASLVNEMRKRVREEAVFVTGAQGRQ